MFLEGSHKEKQYEVSKQLSKAWKKDSFVGLGKESVLERLEVKRGKHHIPNP